MPKPRKIDSSFQMKHFSLFLVLGFLVSPAALADVFQFSLRGYPKEDRNCFDQTRSIAQKFEEGTKVKVVHVECVAERQTGYDFSIEYEAPKKLEFTSTDYSFVFVGNAGRYREQSDCLKNLPVQIELFTQATGLAPVFSYCRSLELSVGKNWEVIITAKGISNLKPSLGSYLMFAKPQGITYEEVYTGLKNALSKQGAILSDLIFHFNSVMGTGEGAVHYFWDKQFHFSMERVTKVPTFEACSEQARDLKAFLGEREKNLFAIYCGDRQFGAYDLHVGFIEKPALEWPKSMEKFSSFSECVANKDQVIKHHQGSALSDLLGGLCSEDFETRAYHVILFKLPK
ncbi:hypothetical protein EBQ90_10715 [bacterium]|nr:hypothetical protein [bacterium]